ncbi:MAG: flavin reductase [Proteobacteria bacterium]|nr:flavin reductase [Pseudomonadota bacterium]MDE2411182.1 flavin reductase [Sphingomonadales bacterium]
MTAPNQPHDEHLKRVLRHLPAPVGIVSSFDPASGDPVGLAMSALMPVSLEPSSMAIAINRAGSAHDAMIRAGMFCINLLDTPRQDYLTPFASFAGRADRFTHPDWKQNGPVWFIEGAPANIFCEIRERLPYGTHDLLIGEVYDLMSSGGDDILGWANGALGRLSPLDKG